MIEEMYIKILMGIAIPLGLTLEVALGVWIAKMLLD